MTHWRRAGFGAILTLTLLMNLPVRAADSTPAALWADFNHYVLIARPDLAQALGSKLLTLDDAKLLDTVEASEYTNTEAVLYRAGRIETLADVAKQLAEKIQSARIARSREPARIASDIQKLGEGTRASLNATERLRAAGQYAAPALLAALQDETKKPLHPFIVAAMVASGRPLVYPLAVAVPQLEPREQTQILQVLAEIGYPRALPYIREVIDNPRTDPSVRQIAEAAFRHLAEVAGAPTEVNAAELYLTLAQNLYNASVAGDAIAGFDPSENKGMVWDYNRTAGLIATPVPARVFGYILSMRAAHRALELQPDMTPALSLWLMGNLVRENLLDGEKDPSYPRTYLSPAFYLKAAGPLRQHDVLNRALDDRDTALALDAIAALTQTAGTDALVNRDGTSQPLLRALTYPDRKVRFRAAFALTNARPEATFPGSHRVVPVLAEAIRQTSQRYAVALATTDEQANRIAAVLRDDLGMQVSAGRTLAQVLSNVNTGPGVDVIVAELPVEEIVELQRQRAIDYKFAAAPLLVLARNASEQTTINSLYERDGNVFPVLAPKTAEELQPAIEAMFKNYGGKALSEEEADAFALQALDLLYEIGIGHGKVYNIGDAQIALIQSLADEREPVILRAAKVLSLLPTMEAQRAIGDAALDLTRPSELRVQLLGSLAISATSWGNLLTDPQLTRLLELVKTSEGEMSEAAARVHGALALPTSNVVEMLNK